MEIKIAKQYAAIKDAEPTVTLLAAYVVDGL
jgi:hypothetical protein